VNQVDLAQLGFEGIDSAKMGRPSYQPSVMLNLHLWLPKRTQSSRCLETEANRNVELMLFDWCVLTQPLPIAVYFHNLQTNAHC
jgi:hypothetical protein